VGKIDTTGKGWGGLVKDMMADPDARVAYLENNLRRTFGERLSQLMIRHGVTDLTGLNLSHEVRKRLTHDELGGQITLNEMVRAADAVGHKLTVLWEPLPNEVLEAKNDCKDDRCESCLNNDYGCPGRLEGANCPDVDEDEEDDA
jgi:hypothetical protein